MIVSYLLPFVEEFAIAQIQMNFSETGLVIELVNVKTIIKKTWFKPVFHHWFWICSTETGHLTYLWVFLLIQLVWFFKLWL
jgi:hypothetical protein